jgi:hypothetical protein
VIYKGDEEMKEVKVSLGRFKTMEEFKEFLHDDNERPYYEAKYRRKLGLNVVRNAFIEEFNQKIWVFSKGYGLEFMFSEEEKNDRIR